MKNINSSSRENNFNMDFQNNQSISSNEVLNNLSVSMSNERLETGINFLDTNTDFFKGNVSLFGGRANSKKDKLFIDMALNMASNFKKIAYFSFNKDLDERNLISLFKKRCLSRNLDESIIDNIYIVLVRESSILRITKELSELNAQYNIDAVFMDDDKNLLFGDNTAELRNNFVLKDYLSYEVSQMAKLFNVHIFIGARVKAKCEEFEIIEDINDIKCSFRLIGLAKCIVGLGYSNDENIWNLSFLKNCYGDVNINSKVNIK